MSIKTADIGLSDTAPVAWQKHTDPRHPAARCSATELAVPTFGLPLSTAYLVIDFRTPVIR